MDNLKIKCRDVTSAGRIASWTSQITEQRCSGDWQAASKSARLAISTNQAAHALSQQYLAAGDVILNA
jgi:hypothetical protein